MNRILAIVAGSIVLSGCASKPLVLYTMDDTEGNHGGLQRVFPQFIDQPTVLAFWSPDSAEAIDDLVSLNTLAYRDGPVQLVGVCSSSRTAKSYQWFRRQNVVFEMISDPDGTLAQRLKVRSYPTYIFFDKTGKEIDRRLDIRTINNWFDRPRWHRKADPGAYPDEESSTGASVARRR